MLMGDIMRFEKTNNNPLGIKTGDCVIRAISLALNKSWDEVFNDLVKIAKIKKSVPNQDIVYFSYLEKYERVTIKAEKDKKRLKVEDIKYKNCVVKVANHITCIKDGVLCDIWDIRKKAVYRYWIIEEIKQNG